MNIEKKQTKSYVFLFNSSTGKESISKLRAFLSLTFYILCMIASLTPIPEKKCSKYTVSIFVTRHAVNNRSVKLISTLSQIEKQNSGNEVK